MKKVLIIGGLLAVTILAAGCGAGSGADVSETGSSAEAITSVSCGDTVSPEEAADFDAETVIVPEEDVAPYFTSSEISDEVYERINGKSFQEGGQIAREDLRYLRVLYVGFDEQSHIGEMIVNKKAVEDVLAVFRELYDAEYQIRRMVLVDRYYDIEMEQYKELDRGNQADCVSIEDDNTSAFNYRCRSNSSEALSNHAFGFAIDLNPYENPYVNADGSLDGPEGSEEYLDRSKATVENHMLKDGDIAVAAFKAHGFTWGGDWEGDKDYQHFDYADR